jgi:SNF2 family DNA or RNA helicase
MDKSNLHKYQKVCVEHIISHPFCGVFLDMGLGKTISTLTAIEELKYDYCEIDTVLVIAPKRVAETVWEEEAKKWDHTKHLTFSKIIGTERQRLAALKVKADVHIISRDNIAWLCSLYAAKLPYDMLVIDELSSFKAHQTQRFKSLRLARPWFKRVVGLTGTPAPNGLINLWSQMYLIDRGERLEKTITAYRSRYFRPGASNGYVVYSYKLLSDSERLIQERIKDICISMRAEDYLEMPERIDNFVRVTMPDKLMDAYKKFEQENVITLANEIEEGTTTVNAVNAAALSNKLLQFANGAMYDENKNVVPIHDLKLEALKEIIEAADGKPVLVAWTYQFDRDRIKNYFRSMAPRELKTAEDINDWNAGKVKLMLAHPASAGHGINLQAGGNIIVWYGLTWSLELYQQFNARLYRQGQKQRTIIHHIVNTGTHDEDVVRALKSKDKTQNNLMNSIKAKLELYRAFMNK